MNTYVTRINGLPSTDMTQYLQNMVAELAHQLGCREMGIYRYSADRESTESRNGRLDGIIAGISAGDVVICQFPTGNGLKFERDLVMRLKAYGARIGIFIQGIEHFEGEGSGSIPQGPVELYNLAEILIVPSLSMWRLLLKNGIKKDMKYVIQEMWDYVTDRCSFGTPNFKKEIPFIGHERFEGLEEWGGRKPDELWSESVKGGWGLVWHKEKTHHEDLNYLLSLSLARYLSMGIPVIVPAGISNQSLIEKNGLGIVAKSLEDASKAVESMKKTEYQEYSRCVEQFAPALRNGFYTRKCLIEAMQAFYRKDAGSVSIPADIYDMESYAFRSTVLNVSYGGAMALSWSFAGEPDGFLVYGLSGELVGDTRNIHQHYMRIDEHKECGYIVKAYVDTLKGKLIVAESEPAYSAGGRYGTPKVSLIIPAYNAEDYIARSIDTVLAQSFSDFEIIIVDDGSMDGTSEIIDWYASQYDNIVAIHQENSGVAAARNTGIERARGDYIGFMDSDDMLHPELMERMFRSAEKNDCDIVITSVYKITNNGYEKFIQYPMKENVAVITKDFLKMLCAIGWGYTAVVWNKLYRSSLVKPRPFPVLKCDDSAWTPYILSHANRICYLNGFLYEYDRIIRNSTLIDEWCSESKEDRFMTYKNLTMFYLENADPKYLGYLKDFAKKDLLSAGRRYSYAEYERLWKHIEETISG